MGSAEKGKRCIALITFESKFAKSGGVGAVMSIFPEELVKAGEKKVIVVAPYFKHITTLATLEKEGKINSYSRLPLRSVVIQNKTYDIELLKITDSSQVTTYLVGADSFFVARGDPYINPCVQTLPTDPYTNPINPEKLNEDVLFFCAVIPNLFAFLIEENEIASDAQLVLHLNDWEVASVSKAIKTHPLPGNTQVKCVLTLHNSYDRGLTNSTSSLVYSLAKYIGLNNDETILRQALPLCSAISTVSRGFVEDLISDPLQTQIFADHLQPYLRRIIGIDNGCFGNILDFPFSTRAIEQAKLNDFQLLLDEKMNYRNALGEALPVYLKELKKHPEKSVWGTMIDLSDNTIPIFFILGRDDSRVKGIEGISEAAVNILSSSKGKARFIFAPLPGDEGLYGMGYLRRAAEAYPWGILALPFRLSPDIFKALARGCSYMVVNSYFEPFGGVATEAYLNAMPVIARATGGLTQLVIPHPESQKCLSVDIQNILRKYPPPPEVSSVGTGFLYREGIHKSTVRDWQTIVDCAYWNHYPKGDRVYGHKTSARANLRLFQDIVKHCERAIRLGVDLYQNTPMHYAEMIYNGSLMLPEYTWARAVHEYQEHLY